MIFYLLSLLGYYRIINKPVPGIVCLAFFGVVMIPPVTAISFLQETHRAFNIIFILAGWITWTFAEYFIHRFIMHRMNCPAHHRHHSYSAKARCWLIKQTSSLAAVTMFFIIAVNWHPVFFLLSGFMTGVSVSLLLHRRLHLPETGSVLNRLRNHHESHHRDHTTHFGIITTVWDLFFNTTSEKRSRLDKYLKKLARRKNIHSSKTFEL